MECHRRYEEREWLVMFEILGYRLVPVQVVDERGSVQTVYLDVP